MGRSEVVLTQNVDRLHQAAGSEKVVDLHDMEIDFEAVCQGSGGGGGPRRGTIPQRTSLVRHSMLHEVQETALACPARFSTYDRSDY